MGEPEEPFLRNLVDKLPGMVAYWDSDLRCRFANRAYVKWFGVEPEQLLGKHISELLGPLYPLNRPYIEGALRGEEQEFEREIPDPKGGPPRHSQAHYIPDEVDGKVRGFCVLVVDITRRKQAEDGLLRMERQLQSTERLAAMATLAAGMAHEINNPLAIALSNLELVLEEGTPAVARGPLIEAREAARRIGAIVEGMKLLAQGDPRRREPVDVNKTLDQSVALASNVIRYRAHLVREHEDVGYVLGDASQLAQVVVNLLVNAAQALPEEHTERNEIRLSSRRTADGVIIEVRDNGCGIPEELHAKIFEPFFTTKDVGVGMGLGLSISAGIVAALGGRLSVQSQVGTGSVFTVILPPSRAPAPRSTPPAQEAAPASAVPERLRVLIIDDEIALAHSLARVLRTHEVTVMDDGEQAIAALLDEGRRFDLVLCDLMMPQISGADLYARVTQRRPELAPLFVFMTGGAFTPRGREFLQSVSAPVLEKPFDLRRVRELVAGYTARYQTGR
jgi:PAS domain S-box-containing protein